MRRKVLSMVVGTILIAVFLAVSFNVSASDVTDPKALIGIWAGTASRDDGWWSSDFIFEIFDVDPNRESLLKWHVAISKVVYFIKGNLTLLSSYNLL